MSVAKLLKHDFTKGDLKLYNSNCKETYFENSNGSWVKREYDSNGNETYFENSIGFWHKSEYDANSNVIYSEYFAGYWYKKEFDSNGNQIYYENSKGTVRDNRPKPKCNLKTVTIDGIEYELKAKK